MIRNKIFHATILIIGLIVISYGNSVINRFSYDDISVVAENKFITDIAGIKKLFGSDYFALSGEKTYRPVVTLTYIADCYFWGKNPHGYHLTNLVLHTVSAAVVFLVGLMLLNNKYIALTGALLFGCHPVFTESVCSVAFREDILCAIFMFSAFLCYLLFRKHENIIFMVFAWLFYLISVFSKEMGVVLLPVMVIFDLFYFRKPESWVVFCLNYILIAMVTAFFFTVRFYWLNNPGDFFYRIPFSPAVFLKSLVSYWSLYFFPLNLRPLYYHNKLMPFTRDIIFAVISLSVGLYGFISLKQKEKKTAVFFIVITYISFLPVLNIYPIRHVFAERYMYLPALGFLFFMAIVFYNVKILAKSIYINILLMSILVVFSSASMARNSVWMNNFTLWHNAAKKNPWLAEAFFSLGHAYQTRGNFKKAVQAYKKAIKLNPDYFDSYVNLGKAYEDKGFIKESIRYYKAASEIKPEESVAHFNLALIYFRIDEADKALHEFKECVKYDTRNYIAFNAIGNIYLKKGRPDKAKFYWEKSIEANPENAQAYVNLGLLFLNAGNPGDAGVYFRKALEIDPKNKIANENIIRLNQQINPTLQQETKP